MLKTIRAFKYALQGFRYAFLEERNFRIEIFCAVVVITLGIIFKLTSIEWFIVVLNMSIVLFAELFNTAIEKLADVSSKEINPTIKIVKDVAAAAVVVSVICAFVCGLIIFIPIIYNSFLQ